MFNRFIRCCTLFFSFFRVQFQLLYGAWRVFGLPEPRVSIFGSARVPLDNPYAQKASKLAQRLVENNISVLTGGGPGIMEAATCGAEHNGKGHGKSLGIGVRGLREPKNKCLEGYIELNYFFARKWLLSHYSQAFIVFPGGFGTLDELTEALTLMQTKKLSRAPIILIGVEYWDDFMVWVKKEALEHGLIAKEDLDLFTLTDDLDEAFCIVRDKCKLPVND